MENHRWILFRVVIPYIIFSALWIFLSDRILAEFVTNPYWLTQAQTYKGWFFVAVSAALIGYLLIKAQASQKQIRNALDSSLASFERLFSNNPIPMWVYDEESLDFLTVNDAACDRYGYTRREFSRMRIPDIYPPEDLNHLNESLSQGERPLQHSGQWRHLTKDQKVIYVDIVSHSMEFAGRDAILVSAEDVTEQERIRQAYRESESKRTLAENYLRLDEARLEVLFELSQIAEISLREIIHYILEKAVDLSKSEMGFIGLIYPAEPDLDLFTYLKANSSTSEQFADGSKIPVEGPGLWRQTIARRQPVIANELPRGTDSQADFPITQFQVDRFITIPILDEEKIVCLAGIANKETDYTESDIRQLSLLITGMWQIIRRNQIQNALRESQSRLQTAIESLPFDFWVMDTSGRYVMQNQVSLHHWGRHLGMGVDDLDLEPAIRNQWKENDARALNGELVHNEMTFRSEDREEKTVYSIVAPIRDNGRVNGILGINIDISDLKQRERELSSILAFTEKLRSTSVRSEIITATLDQTLSLVNADGAIFVPVSSNGQEMTIELGRGIWDHLTGFQFTDEQNLIRKVLGTGQPYICNQADQEEALIPSEWIGGLSAVACLPLKADQEVIAGLWVSSHKSFTENELALLNTTANIAANAIHRAILSEQTERQLQRLTALRAIDLAISASLDVRVTLNILLNQITTQLHVSAADVLLYHPHTQTLEYAAGRGFQTQVFKTTRLHLGESHAGKVALERKIIFIPDLAEHHDELFAVLKKYNEPFTSYIALPLIAKGQVKGVIEIFHRTRLQENPEWLDFLQAAASQAAIAIDNTELFDQLQRTNVDLTLAYDATIEGWSRALELRDRETEGHTRRVTEMTLQLARSMGIEDDELTIMRRGILLHDIGKMAIPDSILLKPGPLTPEERAIMSKHPQYAYELLSPIPYLRASLDIPYCHHETWDGSGYPRGLKGEQIPLPARIFTLVDVWDALSNDRPYRKAWPKEKVIQYIRAQSGKRFDPKIAEIFIQKILEDQEKNDQEPLDHQE